MNGTQQLDNDCTVSDYKLHKSSELEMSDWVLGGGKGCKMFEKRGLVKDCPAVQTPFCWTAYSVERDEEEKAKLNAESEKAEKACGGDKKKEKKMRHKLYEERMKAEKQMRKEKRDDENVEKHGKKGEGNYV